MSEEQQKRREQAQEWRDQIYRDLGQLSLTDPLAKVVDGMVSNLTHYFNQEIKEQADRIAKLEKEPLREVGIQEICQWVVGEYPLDVFTGESGDEGAILIAALRDKAAEILKFRK